MTPLTQKKPKSEVKPSSKTEEELCPICDEPFTRSMLIQGCTILPDELSVKYCFLGMPEGIIVIEHGDEYEFDEDEAVEIEIN